MDGPGHVRLAESLFGCQSIVSVLRYNTDEQRQGSPGIFSLHDANLVIVDPKHRTRCDDAAKTAAVKSGAVLVRGYDWLCRCITSEAVSAVLESRIFVDEEGAPMRMAVAPSPNHGEVLEMRKTILVRLNTCSARLSTLIDYQDNSGVLVDPVDCDFVVILDAKPDFEAIKRAGSRSGTRWCTRQWILRRVAAGTIRPTNAVNPATSK